MKTILTIGHYDYVLADGAKIEAIIKALAGAVRVDWDYESDSKEKEYFIGEPVELRVKQVPLSQFKHKPGTAAPAEFDPPQARLNGARRPLLLAAPKGRL